MSSITQSKLFQPIQVGLFNLNHRIVLAPLTRLKASKTTHIPDSSLVTQFYSQRSTSGGLLITEATIIAPPAAGRANAAGIWNQTQINGWKRVVDGVHSKGGFIFLQLWALGRTAVPESLAEDDEKLEFVAPSTIPLRPASGADSKEGKAEVVVPRALTTQEVEEYVRLYAQAAKNAVFEVGFDGVEIHGANGFLVDQFIQDVSNNRTDKYGGSVEARNRFALEVVDAVVDAVGEDRTAFRMSPWNESADMRMKDPVPQFTHLVEELKEQHPNLAYIHVIEPRVSGHHSREASYHESNDFIRKIWSPRPMISAGGYTRELAMKAAEANPNSLIAFGRSFLSNPDLPERLRRDIALNKYDRSTFYIPADAPNPAHGYIDYPFADEAKREKQQDREVADLETAFARL